MSSYSLNGRRWLPPPNRGSLASRALTATPTPASRLAASQPSSSGGASRATQLGLGLGLGLGRGKGKGAHGLGNKPGLKRHRKMQRDTIKGVTKGDIRRLARRGGIKRISAPVYDEIREVLKARLKLIIEKACIVCESSGRKTLTVRDVIYGLNMLGKTIYGFDR